MPNLKKKSKQNRRRSQRFKLHMIRRRTGIDLEFLEIDPATCTCFHILAGQIGVRSWCGRETNNYISGLYPFTPIQYSFVEMIDPKPNFKTPRKKETYDSEVQNAGIALYFVEHLYSLVAKNSSSLCLGCIRNFCTKPWWSHGR